MGSGFVSRKVDVVAGVLFETSSCTTETDDLCDCPNPS